MIGALVVDVRLPAAHSLKEKRALVRPIIDVSRSRFRVAIAETDYQDQHQRAGLEVAAVASAHHVVTEMLDSVERLIWSAPGIEVISTARFWLDDD
ncbi:MAG: DUF503 domain-containing protein [Acidimicrobiales bacterium]